MSFTKFKQNIVHYTIYLTIGFILLSTALSFWNRYVTYDTRTILEEAETVLDLTKAIDDEIIKPIEANVNAYAVAPDASKLNRHRSTVQRKDSILQNLLHHLHQQKGPVSGLQRLTVSLNNFGTQSTEMISKIEATKPTVPEEVKNFHFADTSAYHTALTEIQNFENEIRDQAQSDYEWSIADNAIIQIILILLSIPILLIASKKLAAEVKNNQQLLRSLDSSNRQYLFDDKQPMPLTSNGVVENSIASLRKASEFVERVSKGEHQSARMLLGNELREANKKTLMGALVEMSIKLEKNEEADRQRQWIAEGLNQFYEIVRINQNDLTLLADKMIVFLVKYLKSQQGSLFIVRNQEEENFLELLATYAFERKKWLQKKVNLGDGLLGQAYQEGEHILMTDIPANYLHITSGLGLAMPRCLLIMPFTYNGSTEAVLEIASFTKFESHQIEFLKKAGEFFAGTLQNVNKNMRMQLLLEQSQEQAETLKAQEEELRQNMEELAATNEAMRRRGLEEAENQK